MAKRARLIGGPHNGKQIDPKGKRLISLPNPDGGEPCWYAKTDSTKDAYLYAGNHSKPPKERK